MSKTITVNVSEEVDGEFRKQAGLRYGKRKGYLGRALTEAMSEWTRKKDSDAVNRGLVLLNEGIRGRKWKFDRNELHER
jgi:hypothetical protein